MPNPHPDENVKLLVEALRYAEKIFARLCDEDYTEFAFLDMDKIPQALARFAAELEAWFPIIKRRLALLPVQRTVTVEELTKAMDAVYKLPGTAFWDHRRLCSEILSRINGKEGV